MDSKYQHPSIQLFIMSLKPQEARLEDTTPQGITQPIDEARTVKTEHGKDEDGASSSGLDEVDNISGDKDEEDDVAHTNLNDGKLSEWEARRFGSMAARLLRDVKIT